MNRFSRLLCSVAVLILPFFGRADDLAERAARSAWFNAFKSYQAASKAEKARSYADARKKYVAALALFDAVRRGHPDWNVATVKMRMENCRTAVSRMDKFLSAAAKAEAHDKERLTAEVKQVKLALADSQKQAKVAVDALKKLEELSLEMRRLEKENGSLRGQLRVASATDGSVHKKELSAALKAIDEQRLGHTHKVAKLNDQIRKQGLSLREMTDKLRAMSLKELDSRGKLLNANRVFGKLKGDLAVAQGDVKTLKKELTQTKLALAEHQTRAKALQASNIELRTTLKALKKDDEAALRTRAVEQELTIGVLRGKLQDEAKAQRALKAKTKSLSEDLDILQTANGELRTRVRDLTAHGLEELCGELKATIEQLQAKRVDLTEQNQRLRKNHKDQLEISKTLRQRLAETSTESKTPAKEIRKLRELAAKSAADCEILRKQADAGLASAKAERTKSATDRVLLRTALNKQEELQQELANCQAQLEQKADNKKLDEKLSVMLANAAELHRAGESNKAVALCEQVLALDEDSFPSLLLLGTIQLERKRLPEAARRLRRATSLKPDNVEAQGLLARVLLRQGKGRASLIRAMRAHELQKDKLALQRLVGQALAATGWHQAAETELLKTWKVDKTDASTALSLVELYLNWRPPRRKAANEWYSKARRLGVPADPELEKKLAQKPATE